MRISALWGAPHPCRRQLLHICASVPILIRAVSGRPIRLPVLNCAVDDHLLLSLSVVILLSAFLEVVFWFLPGLVPNRALPRQHQLPELDNVCYFCVEKEAASKCGGCHLVFYCGRVCQMAAWRKHRHACGAAVASAQRIERGKKPLSPSQWRNLQHYTDFVRLAFPDPLVKDIVRASLPKKASVAIRKLAKHISANPDLVSQEMADAVWATGLSMRSSGDPNRFHIAWAWCFLEASVEGGSPGAFLGALGMEEGGVPDLHRITRWMRRGVWQAILMLNKRNEVGKFLRKPPEINTE